MVTNLHFLQLYYRASVRSRRTTNTNIIPNAQITASSNYLSYYPHKGRLNGDSGWCRQSSRITDAYIQVDIGAGRTVCGVTTQGKANGSFIKSYRLSFCGWTAYKEQNVEKV